MDASILFCFLTFILIVRAYNPTPYWISHHNNTQVWAWYETSTACEKAYSCVDCYTGHVCQQNQKKAYEEVYRFKCPEDLPYCDPDTGTCVSEAKSALCGEKGNFTCMKDGYFPHPLDCSKYFICYNLKAYEFSCGLKNYYNSKSENCNNDYICYGFNCVGRDGTKVRYGNDPSIFAVCYDGKAEIVDKCLGGYELNHDIQECDLMCRHEGSFVNIDDCTKYYKCSYEKHLSSIKRTLHTCPEGEGFSSITSRCELFDNVPGCRPSATTKQPFKTSSEVITTGTSPTKTTPLTPVQTSTEYTTQKSTLTTTPTKHVSETSTNPSARSSIVTETPTTTQGVQTTQFSSTRTNTPTKEQTSTVLISTTETFSAKTEITTKEPFQTSVKYQTTSTETPYSMPSSVNPSTQDKTTLELGTTSSGSVSTHVTEQSSSQSPSSTVESKTTFQSGTTSQSSTHYPSTIEDKSTLLPGTTSSGLTSTHVTEQSSSSPSSSTVEAKTTFPSGTTSQSSTHNPSTIEDKTTLQSGTTSSGSTSTHVTEQSSSSPSSSTVEAKTTLQPGTTQETVQSSTQNPITVTDKTTLLTGTTSSGSISTLVTFTSTSPELSSSTSVHSTVEVKTTVQPTTKEDSTQSSTSSPSTTKDKAAFQQRTITTHARLLNKQIKYKIPRRSKLNKASEQSSFLKHKHHSKLHNQFLQ